MSIKAVWMILKKGQQSRSFRIKLISSDLKLNLFLVISSGLRDQQGSHNRQSEGREIISC